MIRHYRPTDLDELLAAWETASAVAHPFLSDAFMVSERNNIATVYMPNAETWVWESDGRVVGFIAMVGDEIGGLFVDPSHHRGGIGRALVDHARARRERLEVEVFEANAIGRAFYASYGFEPIAKSIHEETGNPVLRLALADKA